MGANSGKPTVDLVLSNIRELLTLLGTSSKPVRFPTVETLGLLRTEELCIGASSGRISFVGRRSELSERFATTQATEMDCHRQLVMPGFVDAHTHAIFAGTREGELSAKLAGRTYMEILQSGGGILKTVRDTKKASDAELISQTVSRLNRMASFGTTTVEIKSGYALTVSGETRLLELLEKLRADNGHDIVPTLLSAHAVPPEYAGKAEAFVSEVVTPSVNIAAERKLAKFCDVFLEEGVFGYRESEAILSHAERIGLQTKIHADEFSDQHGAELGAKLGVVSADHLGRSSLEGISKLAKTNSVAVLLPGTLFSSFVGTYAKARQYIDLGLPVAIASDLSPNSWIESMQFVISLACYGMRITSEEAITAATINGAHALSRGSDVGSIEVGKRANLLICNVENYQQIPYRIASNVVDRVLRNGKLIVQN
jgi:imidazolonepropionase